MSDPGHGGTRPGTSGKLVIVLIVAGLLLVASVTLALYFATRQIDEGGASPSSTPTALQESRRV
jgi:hypothetical protein